MDVSKEFNALLGSRLRRLAHMQLGFVLTLLSKIVAVLRFVLRFEMLRALQRKLYRLGRDSAAAARGLPPVSHPDVVVLKSTVEVPGENVVLNGDVYLPVEAQEGRIKVPAILIRTPYDKDSPLLGPSLAWIFAERGYAVLLQDTRGRFGSGGDFFPIAHEVKDGTKTVEWLRKQPWCNGKIGTHGVSYLGLTAYAATGGGQKVDACCPVMACSRLYPVIYHGGSAFNFDLVIRWLWLVLDVMHEKNPFRALYSVLQPHRRLESALHPVGTKPVHHRDLDIVGKELEFYRQVMENHELGMDFWTEKDILCDLSKVDTPLTIIAGWHDMFTAQSFKDLEMASKVKTDAPLTLFCGPWSHWQFVQYTRVGFKAALELFEVQLKGAAPKHVEDYLDSEEEGKTPRPTRVCVQVLHSESSAAPNGRWLQFHTWPPVKLTSTEQFFLADDGILTSHAPVGGGKGFTEQVYDPQNPTPNYGGPSFDWNNSGPISQNDLEGRDDVLTFTTSPFTESVTVIGEVTMKLFLWSSNPHTDVFVKVCDVDGRTKKSINVMEKMTRLSPTSHKWDADGNVEIDIDVGPIAVEFKKGNCLRIHVSGAAHPLYLRHNGTENHLHMDMKPALRKIKHSPGHPSFISCPVLRASLTN